MLLPLSAKHIPAVSVIMAVYNGEDCVSRAIDSILSQSYENFEFIIIDDGSNDATPEILASYSKKDPRIIIITNENKGLTQSLNIGISAAAGALVARQDADDISLPHRLEKQVKAFENDPELILLGTRSKDIHENGLTNIWPYHHDRDISKITLAKTPFPHSTAMIRASALKKSGCYDESYKTSQDMELWMRLSRVGKISMVDEVLIDRFVNSASISVKRRWRQMYDGLRARLAYNPNKLKALMDTLYALAVAMTPPVIIKKIKDVVS